MTGRMDLGDLKGAVADGTIDTILVCFTDMQGRLIGKRVTGHFFMDHAVDEMHACDYLLALDMEMEPVPGFEAASWDLGYGDFVIKPDLATLRRIPWLDGTALVLGDCYDPNGQDVPHSPRGMLKTQLDRLRERGWVSKMGSELELYLFDDSFEGAHEKHYRDLKTAGWYREDYHIFQTTKEEGLVRAIRNGMDAAGIPVEFSKGEWSPGQEEINLRYAEALEMADRHVIYKNGVKEIAFLQGKSVTFMAKWNIDEAGNSCHLHSSLWDANTNQPLFHDADGDDGMSDLFRHYLAGQLACASDMTYFFAPFINSYKRFQSGSFAPTRAAWSHDNRTAGFRLCGHGPALRIECRIPGADINPYLAFAATVAAGLHGIENKLPLSPKFSGNIYDSDDAPHVPTNLRDAVDALDQSTVMRAALGDAVVDHYVHAGRWEIQQFETKITDWELSRYFERA